MAEALLELRGITKSFSSLVANDHVDLTVLPGRIHALVGENGAGKTTLMSMIAGTQSPDSGQIVFAGEAVRISSPIVAAGLGIGMVHQHFKLVGSLTVAANVFLGRELTTRSGRLDVGAMEAEVGRLSERFGLAVDPKATTRDLSVGEAQRVEVLKALSHETRLLILDEPTAVLTPAETEELFEVIRGLARQGCAVLFISHKLDEVLAIADEVTVIRDGRVVGNRPAASLNPSDLAALMVGREVLLRVGHTPARPGREVLAVRDLTVLDERGVAAVNGLSLSVRAGEIVGLAGVEGNGQSELTAAIAGLREVGAGSVLLSGGDVTRVSVARRREAGLAYIPEDRLHVGTAPSLSVAENAAATHLRPPVAHGGWVVPAALRSFGARLIREFDIRGAHPDTRVGALSGGNMQKVVLAREFESNPPLLVVSQPTRGVDVGATEFVHNSLLAARDRGAGILLASADLGEVMSLADRLLVMHRGRIVAEFEHGSATETAVGLAMAGIPPEGAMAPSTAASHGVESSVPGERTAAVPLVDEAQRAQPVREPWWEPLLAAWLQPVLAILVALVVGLVVIAALGLDPLAAYSELFFSSFSSPQGIGSLIAQSVPLLVLSAGVIISFRAGFFNIGGEGQLFVGALTSALVGVALRGTAPGWVITVAMLVAAFAAGGCWGLIPGALLAFWRVNIIVTTLMMSSIAILLTRFLVTGPFADPKLGNVGSRAIDPAARLPIFAPEYSLGLDLVVALLVVVAMGWVLNRSVWGLRVRELGELNSFAAYTGVNPGRMSMQVMAVSGGVSGLAGALFVLGPNGGRFLQSFSPGYGFLAITVALLARLNPWAAIVASVFYANMMAGSNNMQIATAVPYPMVNVLQGLIILAITGTLVAELGRRRRRVAFARPTLADRGEAE